MFHFLQALLVALAVAIDAATVAACEGISRGCKHAWGTLATIALLFGVLQGGVTAIGYCVGAETIDLVDEYDHWVVLILLVAVGGHMIFDAFARARHVQQIKGYKGSGASLTLRYFSYLLMMGFVTSIDALALGFSFSFMSVPILLYTLVICIVTALASGFAFYVGCKIPFKWISWVELFGGWVLIGIGVKVLIEHLHLGY